jgi:hypothetical protein
MVKSFPAQGSLVLNGRGEGVVPVRGRLGRVVQLDAGRPSALVLPVIYPDAK